MQIGQYRFLPRPWLSVLTLVLLVTFVMLGFWQLDRADEKREIQQQQQQLLEHGEIVLTGNILNDSKPVAYQPVTVKGYFDYKHSILLDNKIYNGLSGYHVITPFQLGDSDVVILVNRGWVKASLDRSKLPVLDNEFIDKNKQPELLTINGMVKYPSAEFKLGENSKNNNWPWRIQWLDIKDIRDSLKKNIAEFIILQNKNDDEKFIREWKIIVSPPEKNLSYAAQWFTLAAVLLIIFIITNTKKMWKQNE